MLVPDVEPGQVYVWRVHGDFDPAAGLRHDASALLLDPYGVAVTVPTGYDRMAGTRPGRDPRTAMKSVVADLSVYDWEGDVPLGRPFARTVIYELHVRGFTAHPTAGWTATLPAPTPEPTPGYRQFPDRAIVPGVRQICRWRLLILI